MQETNAPVRVTTAAGGMFGDEGQGERAKAETAQRADYTIDLMRPLKTADGPVTRLTLREPEQRHVVAAERASPRSTSGQALHMLAALSGIDQEHMQRLSIPDAQKIERWVQRLMAEAVASDEPPRPDEEARTFRLLAPVETDRSPVFEVTLRTPDLGTSVQVEKTHGEANQTAVMIAELGGITVPLVMRMARRDIARMETWLAPFAGLTSFPTDAPGETLQSGSATS